MQLILFLFPVFFVFVSLGMNEVSLFLFPLPKLSALNGSEGKGVAWAQQRPEAIVHTYLSKIIAPAPNYMLAETPQLLLQSKPQPSVWL